MEKNLVDQINVPIRVTLEGNMADVLNRLKLNRPESVALTAYAIKDGKSSARITNFVEITVEIIK